MEKVHAHLNQILTNPKELKEMILKQQQKVCRILTGACETCGKQW